MDNRLVAAAAVVLVAGVAGCSAPPAATGGTTAKVSINGESVGGQSAVSCTQTGWSWIIKSSDEAKGFVANIGTGDKVAAQSVSFRDVGGFTGTFWEGNLGEADVKITDDRFTITGSANGSFTETPLDAVTADFRIEANC